MIKSLVFCEECRKDVQYTIKEESMTGKLKGITYEYIGKAAHCNKCDKEVYLSELHDINLNALFHVYREKNNLISLEKIIEIPQRYGIGKRPLSLLLGWGEQTFTRYCDGIMPTKQYSDLLERIYTNPNYYKSILDSNKDKLKTIKAYEKSKKAVENLMSLKKNESKIDLVINYLLDQCEDITSFVLHKALYYIQGFYYGFYKEFLFPEDFFVFLYGPIYSDRNEKYKEYHYEPSKHRNSFDYSVFSPIEKSIMDSIIKNICCYSGKVLKEFFYLEAPYLEMPEDWQVNSDLPLVLQKEQIGKYFSKVREKYNMEFPEDIKYYAKRMFKKK